MPRRGSYHVVLLQLPYLYNYLSARHPSTTNIPLAAGYLKANAQRVGLLDDNVTITILDPCEADRAGHGRLVSKIVDLEPDMVGFSVYEWNAHQSFDIARTLKDRFGSEIVTVVGGPEIIPNSHHVHFHRHPELDVGVMGDGEATFVELVNHFRGKGTPLSEIPGIVYRLRDGEAHANPLRTEVVPYREMPSPYLLGYLDPEPFGFMLLESERGCPFKCAYCNWSGSRRNLFSLERLEGELALAKRLGLDAVHFLDPTFNTSRNSKNLLSTIKELNADRCLSFHANIYAEFLKDPQIDDLHLAGFDNLTVGLQSVNPVALNNINRKNNLPRFVERVHKMIDRGLNVFIDIIIGLPGDSLDSLRTTLRFLAAEGLDEYSRYNILTVNPDSALWGMKEKFGLEAQSQPPYRILGTREMSFDDLREAIRLCDDSLRYGQCYGHFEEPSLAETFRNTPERLEERSSRRARRQLPSGLPEAETPYSKVIIDVDARRDSVQDLADLGHGLSTQIANAPVIWFRTARPERDLQHLRAFLRAISTDNLYNVWKIVLESEVLYSPSLIPRLESAIEFRINNIDYDLIYRAERPQGEWIRHATRTFPILPVTKRAEVGPLVASLPHPPQFLWNLRFNDPMNDESMITRVPRNLNEGLLVDFGPHHDADAVVETVARLVQKRGGYGRNLLFRNGLLGQALDWRFKGSPFRLSERILTACGRCAVDVESFDPARDVRPVGRWVEAILKREARARVV